MLSAEEWGNLVVVGLKSIGPCIWRMKKSTLKDFKSKDKLSRQYILRPIVKKYGGDCFKYFEKGRFTIVEGELTHGADDVDRIIFRYCPMKWSDNKKRLSATERKKALKAVGEFLDKNKIQWKFSNFGRENLTKAKLKP